MPDPLAGWPGAWPPTEPARPVDARQAVRPEVLKPSADRDRINGEEGSEGPDGELVDAQQREDIR